MSDPITESFWADVRPADDHSWVGRGRANIARFNAAHAPAEPNVTSPPPIDYTMDLGTYAEQRAELGVKTANDFGTVKPNTSGFPGYEDLRLTAQQAAELANPYRRHANTGYQPRERGIPANLVESQDGQHRGRGTISNLAI